LRVGITIILYGDASHGSHSSLPMGFSSFLESCSVRSESRSVRSESCLSYTGDAELHSQILLHTDNTFSTIVETEQLCFICYESAPDAALLECGHAGLCCDCGKKLMFRPSSKCPICRRHITWLVRLRPDLPLDPDLFGTPENFMFSENPPWPLASREHAVPVELVRVFR